MKRYLTSFELTALARVKADVVIVGGGAAGLYTALNLDPGLSCAVLLKSTIEVSNSMYAQGGVAAVMEPNPLDDREKHVRDTLRAGAGLCDEEAVRVLVDEAAPNIEALVALGVPFDRDGQVFRLTREGGHCAARVLHSGGDATGLHLTRRLYEAALTRENIRFFDGQLLTDIVTDDGGEVCGVLAMAVTGNHDLTYFAAGSVVMASGGIGRVYQNSTNALCLSGDGIAAAGRAGAVLKDLEFVQFHPTAFRYPDADGRYFLISESLRGEGGILRNRVGEPFMEGVHPLKDLAPRDIVARAIHREMAKSGAGHVYLDITSRGKSDLSARFPTIYAQCAAYGIDMAKSWIPVLPVQHYFMGGIKTNLYAETNLPGLYACGEAACTGVHGANRLASNSLLECLVFGRRCAQRINEAPRGKALALKLRAGGAEKTGNRNFQVLKAFNDEIRRTMTRACGIVRSGGELATAYGRVQTILSDLDGGALPTPQGVEACHRAEIAGRVLAAALARQNSVGAHYRRDVQTKGGTEA